MAQFYSYQPHSQQR